jgi:hypothetical protein
MAFKAKAIEDLKASRFQPLPSGRGVESIELIDDQVLNSATSELAGKHQSGWVLS